MEEDNTSVARDIRCLEHRIPNCRQCLPIDTSTFLPLCPKHGQVLSPRGECGACKCEEIDAAKTVTGAQADVERFTRAIVNLPLPDVPAALIGPRLEWSYAALTEELDEFNDACERDDVAEAADALVDLIYFALGRLSEMGVPFGPVWDAVQGANMKKQRGVKATRPGSLGHDAVKPEGWIPPDHSWLLRVTTEDIKRALEIRERIDEAAAVVTAPDDEVVREAGSYDASDHAVGERHTELPSATSGGAGKHDRGKAPLSLVPFEALELEARVFEHGREKYGAWNWTKGTAWSRYIDAGLRHLNAFADGEDDDPDSGLSHLGHLRCCAAMLIGMTLLHPELDDRRKNG